MTNPVESIVKVTLHPYEENEKPDEKQKEISQDDDQKTTEDKENEKNVANQEEKPEKIKIKKENEMDDEKKEIKPIDNKENVKDDKKDVKPKTESLVASAIFDRKTERRVDNKCESKAFIPSAEVI